LATPDYWDNGDSENYIWSNGSSDSNRVPTITIDIRTAIGSHIKGQLNAIQYIKNEGAFSNGASVKNPQNDYYAWNCISALYDQWLVDGMYSGILWNPFYADNNSSDSIYLGYDTPKLYLNPNIFLQGVSLLATRTHFNVVSVWEFDDGTVYFIGSSKWLVGYHGNVNNNSNSVSYIPSSNNNSVEIEGDFTRDNTNLTISEPGATSVAGWFEIFN